MARKVYENVMAQATNSFVDSQKNKQSEPIVENSNTVSVATQNEDSKVQKEHEKNVSEQPITQSAPKQEAIQIVDDMSFAIPRSGRPKLLEGKYHNFTARIREDLYKYAETQAGKGKEYQSINDYINRLIARDMLSK